LEEKLDKISFIHARGAGTYHIKAGQSSVEISLNISSEVMIRGAQAIKWLTPKIPQNPKWVAGILGRLLKLDF
jgi:hypothetical protein